jgi:CHAD domain-containing protein
MEAGSELIWGAIACLLPRYSDRERAFSFLLEQAAAGGRCVAHYYQALERLGDIRAVPLLRQRYEEYRQQLAPFEQHGLFSELSDYHVCCRALWKLDGSQEYHDALRELLTHPNETIRRLAYYYLFDQWPQQQ